MKNFISYLLTPVVGIIGLLVFALLIFLPPILFGDEFSALWFDKSVIILALFGVFALVFYMFVAISYHLRFKLSLQWQWLLKGIAAGFGTIYFVLVPIQTLFLVVYAKNPGQYSGLGGIFTVVPLFVAMFAAPFLAALFGYIGYRFGRKRELEKLIQNEKTLVSPQNTKGIIFDTLGIFGLGTLGLFLFLNLLNSPLREVARTNGIDLVLSFQSAIFYLSFPAFAFLGFYMIRLLQRRQKIYQTILAISLILIFVVAPYLLTWYLRGDSTRQHELIQQELSLANFKEFVILKENPRENELKIVAEMNVPIEKKYEIHASLSNDKNRDNFLHWVDIKINAGNMTKVTFSEFPLQKGMQTIEFTLNFSELFKEWNPSYKTEFSRAIVNDDITLNVQFFYRYRSYTLGRYVYHYKISKASFEKLGKSLLSSDEN